MSLYFITSNPYKKEEALEIFKGRGITLEIVDIPIQEIMHLDLKVIVKDKILKAYKEFGLPCVVEHGAIKIEALNGLPGGISKVVWDNIGNKLCKLILSGEARNAEAESVVGYCDGKQIYLFSGITKGTIAHEARGKRMFQWDPIFIPKGSTKTYSELGFPEKERYSQATKAWKKFIKFLEKKG